MSVEPNARCGREAGNITGFMVKDQIVSVNGVGVCTRQLRGKLQIAIASPETALNSNRPRHACASAPTSRAAVRGPFYQTGHGK